MKIKGQFQWTDYLNAQLLHMQPSGFVRVVRLGVYAFVALIFATILFMRLIGQLDINIEYLLPVLILFCLFPLYRYVLLPNRVKKLFVQQKELSLPIEFEFTETGMSSSNELGNSTRPWTNFVKWKENKELILLYHSDVLFSMIPVRFFTDPQQVEIIKSFLEKNKVPKAKSRFMVGCIIYFILFLIIATIVSINIINTIHP